MYDILGLLFGVVAIISVIKTRDVAPKKSDWNIRNQTINSFDSLNGLKTCRKTVYVHIYTKWVKAEPENGSLNVHGCL